jgi:hypothetical protein
MVTMTLLVGVASFCIAVPMYVIALQIFYSWSYPDADISLFWI